MMDRITSYYFQFAEHRALRFMPRIIYGFLFVLWLITLPYSGLVWGADNVLFRFGLVDSLLDNAVLRLYYQPELFPWIYYTHPIFLLLSLRNSAYSFIPRILAWFSGLMLYAAAENLFGTGVILLLQTAFLLVPVHYESTSNVRLWFNSLSMLAMRIQTIVILIVIGMFAWGSAQWKGGDALYYWMHQGYQFRLFAGSSAREATGVLHALSLVCVGLFTLMPFTLLIRHTRFYSTLVLLVIGTISVLFLTNMATGFAIISLALPWIDARETYD